VLAAHALLSNGRLAQENDVADGVLWATGSVRPVDLTVGAVSHVPDKVANSLDRLEQEHAAGRRVLLALPAANAAEVAPTVAGELAARGIEVIAPAHVQALFDAIGMKLPDAPQKAPAPATVPAAAVPGPVAVAAPRRRFVWAAAAAVIALLGAAAATAFVLGPKTDYNLAQGQQQPAPPQPAPVPPSRTTTAAPQPAPVPAPPAERVELVPELMPFISLRDKARIRDEYLPAPDYKAVASSLSYMGFVSGQPSQEAADRAAMEACEKRNSGGSRANATTRICELYAAGNVVVSHRARPAMPPTPWLIRNPTAERPFAGDELPLLRPETRKRLAQTYPAYLRSKALVVSPTGHYGLNYGQPSVEEAMRRTLERCGYESGQACMIVAVDDTFVVPIPTLARAVGFYRPAALIAAHPRARDDVARQLANTTDGWNAVAVGAGGLAGVKVAAGSEQSAIDGALEECGKRDRECRIAVIGPFLVEQDQGSVRAMSNTAPSP
jgi:hypothetical protein